jgi:hypothetical protein
LEPFPITYDNFERWVEALNIVGINGSTFTTTFHLLPMQELKFLSNVTDNIVWGEGGGRCEHEQHNECECGLQRGIPCLVVKKVMHGSNSSMLLIYGVACVIFLKNFEFKFMNLMAIYLFACVACMLWIMGFLHHRVLARNTWVGAN